MNIFKKIKRYIQVHFDTKGDPTKRIISFWEKGGADVDYYTAAERKDWIDVFWKEDSLFRKYFQTLDSTVTLEIACGTGRHSFQSIDKIKKLYLLDSSSEALALAKKKFAQYPIVTFIHNKSGIGIPNDIIADNSISSVFSYDAMVHFEKEAVWSYIKDSYRVLQPGGFALFHHSNYSKNPGAKFSDNPGWRNYMTQELFTGYARECGFEVVESIIISFVAENSDCITLLKKPL